MSTATDHTASGLKLEGSYENDRNSESSDLFKSIIREVYGVQDVIIGHHIVYESRDKRPDGFVYEVVQEIPSADALIFDHDVAKKLWGENYIPVLLALAREPVASRDDLLSRLYRGRTPDFLQGKVLARDWLVSLSA